MWDWKEATIPQQWAYRSPVASGKDTLKDTTTGCTHRGQGFLQRKPECFYRSMGRHWTKIDSGFTTCSPVITASPTHVDSWIRKIIGSENCILSFIKTHSIWIILLRNRDNVDIQHLIWRILGDVVPQTIKYIYITSYIKKIPKV